MDAIVPDEDTSAKIANLSSIVDTWVVENTQFENTVVADIQQLMDQFKVREDALMAELATARANSASTSANNENGILLLEISDLKDRLEVQTETNRVKELTMQTNEENAQKQATKILELTQKVTDLEQENTRLNSELLLLQDNEGDVFRDADSELPPGIGDGDKTGIGPVAFPGNPQEDISAAPLLPDPSIAPVPLGAGDENRPAPVSLIPQATVISQVPLDQVVEHVPTPSLNPTFTKLEMIDAIKKHVYYITEATGESKYYFIQAAGKAATKWKMDKANRTKIFNFLKTENLNPSPTISSTPGTSELLNEEMVRKFEDEYKA